MKTIIKEFPKRNEMVMLKGNNLSIYASKALDYIYREGLNYYENKRDGGIFELNIYELKKEIGMNDKSSGHLKIIKELEEINKLIFETYDNKHYSSFPILAGFELKKNGILEVALSPFLIREMMFNNENIYYHMSNLVEYKELKSKYSKRILDLYKRYHGSIPKLETSKFQGLMQYPEKYRNSDIKKWVLEQAQKELKIKNNMILEWEIEKIGTKWKNIKLNIIELLKKEGGEIEFSSFILIALGKARKNRFIDACYSRKAMESIVANYDEKDVLKALREAYKYNSEILNFSKFLIAKIKDIQNSKKNKKILKESAVKKNKALSELDKKISEVSKVLIKSKKIKLFDELNEITNIKDLTLFIRENKIQIDMED